MKALVFIAVIASALSGIVSAASKDAISLSFQIDRNDSTVAAPRLLVPSGRTAEFRIDDAIMLQVTASEHDAQVLLALKLHAKEGTELALVGSPKLFTKFGDAASLSWASDAGVRYTISVLTTRAKLPKVATVLE